MLSNALEQLRSLTLKQAVVVSILVLVRSDRKYKYLGPVLGSEMPAELMDRIVKLRERVYGFEDVIEKRLHIDARSVHFYVLNGKGELSGALRLTPEPFEMSELSTEIATVAKEYTGYYEVSRYVVDRKYASTAERLLLFAGVWIFRESMARGLIALCHEKLKEHYRRRYGIKDISPAFTVPKRGAGSYYIVKVDFTGLFRHLMERFILRKSTKS